MSMLEKIGVCLSIAEVAATVWFALETRKFINERMVKTMEEYGVSTPEEALKAIAKQQAKKNQEKWFEEEKRTKEKGEAA